MRRLALIGGTGALRLLDGVVDRAAAGDVTPWGSTSGPLLELRLGGIDWLFLPRHGLQGLVPPHRVNYRANIWALGQRGVAGVIGINAVGGITPAADPGTLVIPDQLIDYTWGREHTFFDGTARPLRHVEFDPPFDSALRAGLAAAARRAGVACRERGTYGVTQGPRLETAAEIDRLAADGCDVVGMTAMPEAGLAREAGLAYAICAVVVNRAAGRLPEGDSIGLQMADHLEKGMSAVARLLRDFTPPA